MPKKCRSILTLNRINQRSISGRLPVPVEMMEKANVNFGDCCTVEASEYVITYRFFDTSIDMILFRHEIGSIKYAEDMPEIDYDGEMISMVTFLHAEFNTVTRSNYMYLNDIRFKNPGEPGNWKYATNAYIEITIIGGIKEKKSTATMLESVSKPVAEKDWKFDNETVKNMRLMMTKEQKDYFTRWENDSGLFNTWSQATYNLIVNKPEYMEGFSPYMQACLKYRYNEGK